MINIEKILENKKIYDTRKLACRKGYEAHHIKPVALQIKEYDDCYGTSYGQSPNGRNLFEKEVPFFDDRCYRLTPFEHLLVHYFLALQYDLEKPAFYCMTNCELPLLSEIDQEYILKLENYAKLREEGHKIISEKLKGKSFTEEHKSNISKAKKGKPVYKIRGENHEKMDLSAPAAGPDGRSPGFLRVLGTGC